MLFFTDPLRTPSPEAAIARLPAGSGVVFRAFGSLAITQTARRVQRAAAAARVVLLVGADFSLAATLNARGVHLPQRLGCRKGVIMLAKRRFLVTIAAHDWPSVLRAKRSGADAIVISPLFRSLSPSAGRPLGARRAADWTRRAGVPVYGLGGLSEPTARQARLAGLAGIAAIGALVADVDDRRQIRI